MFSIGSILENYVTRRKKLNRLYLLMLHYSEVVGETIAKHTRIVNIKDHKLIISCRNSIWKRELENYKDTILEKLQPYLQQEKITELVLIIGNVELVSKKKKKKRVELSLEEEKWIHGIIENTHPSYQKAFESLIRSYKEKQHL